MKVGLTIGELAGELPLNPKTIRYYEEVGLLELLFVWSGGDNR
jgi:hypothetical protein